MKGVINMNKKVYTIITISNYLSILILPILQLKLSIQNNSSSAVSANNLV